jgi:hypothetical protein
MTKELVWYPERGLGNTSGTFEYGEAYWKEFREKDKTPVGKILTVLRYNFLAQHVKNLGRHKIVDVGIGGGAFVEMAECMGRDVNPKAKEWLRERNALWNANASLEVYALTFWDSLEHIKEPGTLLACTQWAFISTPIYRSAEHCVHSKHYKPGEHLWYFTDWGLKRWMAGQGFALMDSNKMEESVGREDIGTYAFRRLG